MITYKAELFDQFQYLYEVTGFSDHQIHCVICFGDQIKLKLMRKALYLLFESVPILSSVYHHNKGNSYWESIDPKKINGFFTIAKDEQEFQNFSATKTNESTGPQIRACVYQKEKAELAVIVNHMICDGAGFKQLLYLLSDLYSNLIVNENYSPADIISGDRGINRVITELSILDRAKALLLYRKDSNQESQVQFPMSREGETAPFIISHKISEDSYRGISRYCSKNNVTFNDVILAAFDRVLARYVKVEGNYLKIPIMVDMRRYLKDKRFCALTNLSSSITTKIRINPGEAFDETVRKVNEDMKRQKLRNIGVNGFVKLSIVYRLFPGKIGYHLLEKGLKNPLICMTNIGVIDSEQLVFQGSRIEDVFLCGSIKYRPHFQMAVTSFRETMTLSSNLYGSSRDRVRMKKFLSEVGKELSNLS